MTTGERPSTRVPDGQLRWSTQESFANRADASRREAQLKTLDRKQKLALLATHE